MAGQNIASQLTHGVFNATVDVLVAFKARCVAKGIDFGKFSWIGSEAAPEFDPNDPETVVVLDVTLDTLQNTLEFAWEWVVDQQKHTDRWSDVLSDKSHLTTINAVDFKPWSLSWRRINLETYCGKRPIDAMGPTSPGCALLFMGAEHPVRIKTKRFNFWITGLMLDVPCDREERFSYVLFLRNVGRGIELGRGRYFDSGFVWTSPSFVKE